MPRVVFEPSQLDAIYKDMLARLEMGMLNNGDGQLDGELWGEHLREAITERMPGELSDKHRSLDIFSVAFGAISERILRSYYDSEGKEWW